MKIVQWLGANAPESTKKYLRWVYYFYQTKRWKLLGWLDGLRIIGPEHIYSENYYEKRKNEPWRSDYQAVSEAILELYQPDSVIDFGCAVGGHLEVFYEAGCTIQGVEAHPAAIENALVPAEYIHQHDLRNSYLTDKRFDIALCIEVAEHLPKASADILVDSLCNASDTVIFTAASPGQSGEHHINLQPKKYWIDKFEERGMIYKPKVVSQLRSKMDLEIAYWISDNLMVFEDSNKYV